VPDTLANLQQLSYLGIQNTPINKMTDRVTYLYSLKTLSLRNCSLTQMPNLQYMPNLSSVYLPENQLTKLDGLMYVFYLWISDNLFTELPTQLVPERLSYLMMNNNPLKDVTKLTSFFNLTQIEFSHTTISSIPTDIDKLSKLYSLDLSYSKLEYLPDSILNVANLSNFNIQGNLFSAVEINRIKTEFSKKPGVTLII
jgi:internalin A